MNLSLYIHIPFCKSKCFYCSFASYENKEDQIGHYLLALEKEANLYKGSVVTMVYIGGGTPTYLSSTQIAYLFSIIRLNFDIAPDAEITIEANPATFDSQKADIMYQSGVNRVSLGAQSFKDESLKYLGRPHSSQDTLTSFTILRQAGFKNINTDLIFSLPRQEDKDLMGDLRDMIKLGSEHVSVYSLAISEGSKFHQSRLEGPPPEIQARQYEVVIEWLERASLHQYEVSNFAKEGFECRHNINYWQAGNYIGLGASAHSHRDGHRYWNASEVESYIAMIRDRGNATTGEERLKPPQRLLEGLLIGLRMTKGVDVGELEYRFQAKLGQEKRQLVEKFIKNGFLIKEGTKIKATLSGMLILDELCSRLI